MLSLMLQVLLQYPVQYYQQNQTQSWADILIGTATAAAAAALLAVRYMHGRRMAVMMQTR